MRVDVAILGAGRVGQAAAYDFLRMGYSVALLDVSQDSLDRASERLGDVYKYRIPPETGWISNPPIGAELYAMALPLKYTLRYMEPLLKNGYSVVDATSVPPEELGRVEEWAREGGGQAFLYAGLAPGMAQTLAGALERELGGAEKIDIYVGGVPEKPGDLPLLSGITFEATAFLRQYNRPTRKRVGGEVVTIDPFDDIGRITLPNGEEYEYFLTDGLKSLLYTLETPNLAEYTLRIPGHIQRMSLLRSLGLLDWDPIEVDGCSIVPMEFTAKILERSVGQGGRDRVVLAVYGYRGDRVTILYSVVEYSEDEGFTAMQRATGYNLARYASMVLDGLVEWKVGLPEYIGLDEDLFNKYLERIGEAGIEVRRVVTTP